MIENTPIDHTVTPSFSPQIPLTEPPSKKSSFFRSLLLGGLLLAVAMASIGLWEIVAKPLMKNQKTVTESLVETDTSNNTTIIEPTELSPTPTPLPKTLLTNITGLEPNFFVSREQMHATNTHLLLRGTRGSGLPNLLSSDLETVVTTSNFEMVANDAGEKAAYFDLRSTLADTFVYAYGFQMLNYPNITDFPELKLPGDILAAPIQADGSFGTWNQVGSLPTDIPLMNGGYSLHTNGSSLLVIIAIDGNEYPIYSAQIAADGSLSPWKRVGEIKIQHNKQVTSNSSMYQYHDNTLQVVYGDTIEKYTLTNGSLHQVQTLKTQLPAVFMGNPPKPPIYFFTHQGSLYYLTVETGAKDSTIQMWKSEQIGSDVTFSLVDTLSGIGSGSAYREFRFATNDQNAFILVQKGNSEAVDHMLAIMPIM